MVVTQKIQYFFIEKGGALTLTGFDPPLFTEIDPPVILACLNSSVLTH
jgi:hypothetical protein